MELYWRIDFQYACTGRCGEDVRQGSEGNDGIIKNTIMHELIHCIPFCNDHGIEFKKYAKYINEKLGYNISRVGNKKVDYKNSNIEYKEKEVYNYKVKAK